MAHAQKPVFVSRRNGRIHLNRRRASVQSTTGSRGVRISGSNAGYTMFRGSVNGTGYPLHSPVSPSLPLPCVTVCHHISTGLYLLSRNLTGLQSTSRRFWIRGNVLPLAGIRSLDLAACIYAPDCDIPAHWICVVLFTTGRDYFCRPVQVALV